MSMVLQVNNLKKNFGSKEVLKGIDLSLENGRVLGILGPNGSGKTTLLNLIESFLKPSQGEILINGMQAGVETKGMVSMLQDKNVFPAWMKVKDAIKFYEDFYEDFDENKARELMKQLNIEENDKIKALSRGTLEKFSLILTISRNAKLYILDEPLSGVDPVAREEILDMIIDNLNENSSMIITTHLISELERILDEAAFIKDGQIILKGEAEELRMEKGASLDEIYRSLFRKQEGK